MRKLNLLVILFNIFFLSAYAQQLKDENTFSPRTPKNFNTGKLDQSNSVKNRNSNIAQDYKSNIAESFLDPAFGIGGIVKTSFTEDSVNAVGESAAVQKNGKIIVAGYSWKDWNYYFAVLRYSVDGTIDTTFGKNGILQTQFHGGVGKDQAYAIAIQEDGKIIAAGSSNNNGQGCTFALARYDTNGVLDNTFGTNGTIRTEINGYGNNDIAYSIALQDDGKIVAAGNSDGNYAVVRYNTNGTLDNSFGTNGIKEFSIQGSDEYNDYCRSVKIQSDGKILLGGTSYSFLGGGNRFALARLNTDGTTDAAFGVNGTIRIQVGYRDAEGQSVLIQPDGKILISGFYYDGNGQEFACYRYNSNGIIDSTFGINGMRISKINGGNGSNDKALSSALLPNGKILLAGTSQNADGYGFAVARYDSSGNVDSTFGINGTVRFIISGNNGLDDEANSVVVENNGKIILAGFTSDGSLSRIAAARLESNGVLDISFGINGTMNTVLFNNQGSDRISALAIQPDGKVIAVGTSRNEETGYFAAARYNIDGTLDKTFGINGKLKTSIKDGDGTWDDAASVLIQPDGKIVLAGGAHYGQSGYAFALARYYPNGALDNTFGDDGTVLTIVEDGVGGITSIALQPDGKIVAAGFAQVGGLHSAIELARYNPNGILDNTFGDGGTFRTWVSGGDEIADNANSVIIQTDGKILVGGSSYKGTGNVFAVIRFNKDGTADETFGINGFVTTKISGSNGTYDAGSSIALQSDGKIILGGTSTNYEGQSFALARYNTDGSLDGSFGINGSISTTINGGDGTMDYGNSIAIQSDGKIVLAGQSSNNSTMGIAVARFNNDGSLDNTFADAGSLRYKDSVNYDTYDQGNSVLIQPDGKIIVGGSSSFATNGHFILYRFLPGSMPFNSSLVPTNISDSGATLNGISFPYNNTTALRFLYGTESNTYTDSLTAAPATAEGDTITKISAALYDLSPSTHYYYRISGMNSLSGYFLSEEMRFATFDPIPPIPLIISPDNLTNVPRLTEFIWHSSIFATEYRLQIAEDSLFSVVTFDTTSADTSLKLRNPLEANKLYYWHVSAGDTSGTSLFTYPAKFLTGTLLGIHDNENEIPKVFALYQNYPNPFNPSTTINFDIPAAGSVTLMIFDLLGREVSTLINEEKNPGRYEIKFDASNLANGVYFYQLKAGKFISTKKMLLLK